MEKMTVMLIFARGPESYVVFDEVKYNPVRADAEYTAKHLIDWSGSGHVGKPGFKRRVVVLPALPDGASIELGVAYVPVRDFFDSPDIGPEGATCHR